jgi:hypothetical protein
VCAELEHAVCTESAVALMHWFGVTAGVVWKWRKLFGVNGHTKTRGSRKLQKAASKKGAAAIKARDWSAAERWACSRRSKRLKLKPPNPARVWTAAETALLGTDRDEVIAERLGRTLGAVSERRQLRGIPAHAPAPRREPPPRASVPRWTEAQEALLGTDQDAVIAHRIGRTVEAVAVRRRLLGVLSFGGAPSWTDAELKLLGTATDAALASRLNRTRSSVIQKRIAFGIAPYRPYRKNCEPVLRA